MGLSQQLFHQFYPYNDEMLSYYLSFDLDGADLLTFLTYITLEFPECDPLGVYFTVK